MFDKQKLMDKIQKWINDNKKVTEAMSNEDSIAINLVRSFDYGEGKIDVYVNLITLIENGYFNKQ